MLFRLLCRLLLRVWVGAGKMTRLWDLIGRRAVRGFVCGCCWEVWMVSRAAVCVMRDGWVSVLLYVDSEET